MFPEVLANPWRAISDKFGLMVVQLAKKFIFLKVTALIWCYCVWFHPIVVRRFEYASDPESYTSGSVATGRASLAGQVRRRETPNLIPEAASSVAAWSTEQMMLEMVQVHIATSVTRVVWTAVVLRYGKQMEKLPHYHFSWIVSFQKQRYHICEMLPLETKQSGGKLLSQLDLRGECF